MSNLKALKVVEEAEKKKQSGERYAKTEIEFLTGNLIDSPSFDNHEKVQFPAMQNVDSDDTLFKWYENSCWIDSALVGLFKIPGTWLELEIRKATTIQISDGGICDGYTAKDIVDFLVR